MLQERTGQSIEALARRVKALVVTQGAEGSTDLCRRTGHADPERCARPAVVDPTGCGDAYRAGLLYGIAQGYDWPTSGRLASLMGSIKIASRGGQNHQPTREEIGGPVQGSLRRATVVSKPRITKSSACRVSRRASRDLQPASVTREAVCRWIFRTAPPC